MKNHSCCAKPASGTAAVNRAAQNDQSLRRAASAGLLKIGVPAVLLALLPKCPLCFAAYFAFVTGFGISLTAAGYLQIVFAILAGGAILYSAYNFLRRIKISTVLKYTVF